MGITTGPANFEPAWPGVQYGHSVLRFRGMGLHGQVLYYRLPCIFLIAGEGRISHLYLFTHDIVAFTFTANAAVW